MISRVLFISATVLLCFCCGYGQQRVNVELKGVTFEELISYLEEKFDVSFSYSPDLFEDDFYSVQTAGENLEEILFLISEENDLEYQDIGENKIMIRPKQLFENDDLISSIRFQVLDGESGLPLEYVAAQLKTLNYGAYADDDGWIELNIPTDHINDSIEVQLVGYKTSTVSLPDMIDTKQIHLDIQVYGLDEITVKDRQDAFQSDPLEQSIEFNNLDNVGFTSGLAGSDIMRQVQLLPGLNAHDESSAGLKIRGDDEDQTLIMLDGIPIYNAGHYYGIFSSINPAYVNTMSLYKNNIPIEYGGKTSGMLNIQSDSRTGINTVKGSADINLLSTSLNIQIPISSSAAFLLSGRTTHSNVSDTDFFNLFNSDEQSSNNPNIQNFNLLTRDLILSSVPDFKFNDINAKLIWSPSKGHSLNFNFYNSNDALSNAVSNSFQTRNQGFQVLNTEEYINDEDWSNLGFSLNSVSQLNDHLTLTSSAFYAHYDNFESTTTSLERRVRQQSVGFENTNERKNNVQDFGLRSSLSYEFGEETQELKLGLDIQNHLTDLSVNEHARNIIGIGDEANEYNVFASYRHKDLNGWGIELGLRSSYYDGTERSYLSPRINLSRRISETLAFKGSYGRQYQFVRELSFETFRGRTVNFWTISGGDLPVSSSDNYMIGSRLRFSRVSIDLEAFYKKHYDVIEFALLTSAFDGTSVNPDNQGNGPGYVPYRGGGETRGIDFLLNYTTPKYASWISYTLSKSTYSFQRILRGSSFPSPEDRRHQFKWVNEWKLNQFTFSGNFIFASGRPYTDISILDPNLRRDELRPEDRQSRLPDYSRLDLGINYSFKIGEFDASAGISVFNSLNRDNVKYLQYIFSIPSNTVNNQNRVINTIIGTETKLLPRTFNLNFQISL